MSDTPCKRDGVGIVGAGRWGTTLAHFAAKGGAPVRLYTETEKHAKAINRAHRNKSHLPELERLHDGVTATHLIEELTSTCHLLIIAERASKLRPVMRLLGDTVDGAHVLVHAVRGLEPETLKAPSQVIAEETCARKIGALIGPALVDELIAGRPNAAVVGSRYPGVIRAVQEALAGPQLRIYGNRDLIGVETAGAAASVMALALGICLELNLGPASVAVLMTRGTAEIARLCKAVGGDERTAFGLAGLGGLLVEREAESRDVRAGRLLGQARGPAEIEAALGTVDAIEEVRKFHQLVVTRRIEAHFTRAVYALLEGGIAPAKAVQRLMELEQMGE